MEGGKQNLMQILCYSCHSAEHFFVFKLIVHPTQSFLVEVKTKAASFGLRGGNKIQQDVFEGYLLNYIIQECFKTSFNGSKAFTLPLAGFADNPAKAYLLLESLR